MENIEIKLSIAIWFIKWIRDSELSKAYNKEEYEWIEESYSNILEKLEIK
jgi:hypothetical protein